MPELPTGTVTFLFTDIEGSTRLWEEHPEAMKGALARHDEILRNEIEAHEGQVVKTTGDGVHAAFASAPKAVEAAVAAQQALNAEPWDPEPLRVRMGVHTGEAEYRDGDYYGPSLNRAARLMAAAHGGQVVISNTTEELARDALADDHQLVDLGEHRLRDLARSERVFQVVADEAARDFPPLRSLDVYAGNLPVQLTSFVGRDQELDAISAALDAGRLVTIVGVGGVGKTRLAVQAAADALPRFRDGAWLCELATVPDDESMVQVFAESLGVQQRSGISLTESIVEFLRTKKMLIVLDNCEHLLRAARRLAEDVLQKCPDVRILATSREGFGVSGEQVWPLQSLDVPDDGGVEAVAASDAVVLFSERARSVRPDFRIDAGNAAAIADICRRLDGIPLAIELAAARVVAMTPSDIATRLGERFRLLTGGRHASVERHQTLRAAVDWSYSLLGSVERSVFDRLAVFAGTFDVSAAEAVVAGEGIEGWDVIDALGGLVAKSTVTAEEGAGGAMRYQLLETMRQYALERLEEGGDVDAWRRRHAAHYADIAEQLSTGMRGPQELAARVQLLMEVDNVRAAVIWGLDAVDDADSEMAMRIIAALSHEASLHRSVGVGRWALRAVDRAERSSPARRADVLGAAAYSTLVSGDHERSRELALAALRDGPQPESWSPGLAFLTLGYGALATGRHDEVLPIMNEGHEKLAAIVHDEWAMLAFLWSKTAFGSLLNAPGTHAEAADLVRRARALGNTTAIANSLHAYAMSRARDEPEESLAAFEESVGLLTVGNDNLLSSAYSMSGQLYARRGEMNKAFQSVRAAVVHSEHIGDHPQLVSALAFATTILSRSGHQEPAAVLAGVIVDGSLAEINRFPGSAREHGDRVLVRIEEALGSDAYRRAAARGASMSFEEIVEYTIGELDRVIAEPDDD
jgi:predicted ATPase/class 3 adenylate cyclase